MEVKKQEEIPKRERVYKRRRRRSVGIDRISELPDSLLHHILSFISIEQVVTTCILSTRWKYLWTSIPILDFKYCSSKDPNPANVTKFINFVDRFLLGHYMNIQKFNLDINYQEIDESCINGWISNVINHKVQEISLNTHVLHACGLPPNLFTCESLVKLTIHGDFVLNHTASTWFSRLKILNLGNVIFLDDYSTQQLFSNCPVLEDLTLDHCSWENIKIFNFTGLALKRLAIYNFDYDGGVALSNCVIKIYAPNLVYLSYICFLPKDFTLCNFSSLVDAEIGLETVSTETSDAELGYCASKLLGSLSNVKVLDLSGETFEIFSKAKYILTRLPTFHNLIRLEVSSLDHSVGSALLDLLQISPNLEYLVFDWYLTVEEGCWIYEKVPQCLLLHLKEVKLMQFVGSEAELCALKFLLKNARVLERMIIYYPLEDSKEKLKIAKKLLMLPRGSTNSVIEFIDSHEMYF